MKTYKPLQMVGNNKVSVIEMDTETFKRGNLGNNYIKPTDISNIESTIKGTINSYNTIKLSVNGILLELWDRLPKQNYTD